jgi:hypothetical protein
VCVLSYPSADLTTHTHTCPCRISIISYTHTHTKSKKDDKWLLCQLCNTHKSDAWPPVKILWGPCNLVKKKLFWFFEVVCVRVWETLFFVFNFFNFSWATLKIYFFFFPFQNEIQK